MNATQIVQTWLDGSRAHGRGAKGGPRSKGTALFSVEACDALAREGEEEDEARARGRAHEARWMLQRLLDGVDLLDPATVSRLATVLRQQPQRVRDDGRFDRWDD